MRTFTPLFLICVLPFLLSGQQISPNLNFGTDGFISQVNSPGYYGKGLEVYSDGDILILEVNPGWGVESFTTYRYNPDGTPDLSWGSNGAAAQSASADFDAGQDYTDFKVLDDNEAILLYEGNNWGNYVQNADGQIYGLDDVGNLSYSFSLDYNFDDDTDDHFYGIEDIPGTGYRVFGYTDDPLYFNYYLWVASFGSSLEDTYLYFDGTEKAFHTATLPNGNYLIGGTFFGQAGVVARSSTYSIDTNFGADGFALLPGGAVIKLYVHPDGKILATTSLGIFRLNANGSLDTSYGNNGSISAYGSGYRVEIFCDGKVIFANTDGTIRQYLPDGTLNPDFGTDGVYTVQYNGSDLPITDFELVGDTSFIVFGTLNNEMVVGSFDLASSANDMGIQQILNPVSGEPTAIEEVTVIIKNYGQDQQQDFDVGYQINSEAPVLETINQLLAPGESITYTFNATADLSAPGFYQVQAFSSLAGDNSLFNDTVSIVVEHNPGLNVGLSNLAPQESCGSGFGFQVELSNFGTETITSVDFEVTIDGGIPEMFNWTGNLLPLTSEIVLYSTTDFGAGEYDVSITAAMINNEPDAETSDNTLGASAFSGELISGNTIYLDFETDGFPSETYWAIFNENGSSIASGGPYLAPNTHYYHTLCLPENFNPNCYVLKLWDTYGDGLNGTVEIKNDMDEVLIFVDDFNDNFEPYDFCYYPCLTGTLSSVASGASLPNPGSISVNINDSDDILQYSIDGGQTFQSENIFTDLPAGNYDVLVLDEDGCELNLTIEVLGCTINSTVNATLESGAGMSDATITIVALDGYGSLSYSIDGGQTYQSEPLFEGLEGGIYDVSVLDSEGCLWAESIEVLTCTLEFTVQITEESTAAAQDGTIEISPINGFGDIQYSIDGGITFQSEPNFEGLSAGIYTVLVQDSEGCLAEQEVEVGVNTALLQLSENLMFQCWPNPTSGQLNIRLDGKFNNSDQGIFKLMDVSGRLIKQVILSNTGNFQSSLELQEFSAGIYFWSIEFDGHSNHGRIIKQ